ncbi:RND family efflux transporter, MFP subunit [Tistlia consotensis]|uniref:RND family efflux transporter, MFP subunit n=1 Tax=Tistlia consotensis USBA 355 TaxID=560819 RepID=A0A1Y6B8V2_9PROT|nr:efflux RND transporter periplasmic adaptor subunit [Tistlia consotensis]SME90587.1 RND family efflux transporter, MFP subunit [Tistlia consotensis USBA 355]SNR26818.1 RND family efflux transporter, MFP subunit [Tistlia consotensis]
MGPPALAAALALLATLSAAPAPAQQAPSAAALPFATLEVTPVTARREQIWDGVVEAVHEATMSAQTAGRVLELPYDVNDYVPKGALILRLTDVEQQAAVHQAEAAYEEARANFSRIETLFSHGTASKAAFDAARARRDTAQAALRTAQQQLDYTAVMAPYAGYVTKRFVQVGEEVQPGQPLITGISLDALRVSVRIPQTAAAAIRRYATADILLDGTGARRVAATKVVVFPYADPETHSFTVRLELPQRDLGLFPGETVKCAFEIGEATRLLIPVSALVQRSEVSGVYVVQGREVALRQLRLGHRLDDKVEVLAGLSAGELIAADPVAAVTYAAEARAKSQP